MRKYSPPTLPRLLPACTANRLPSPMGAPAELRGSALTPTAASHGGDVRDWAISRTMAGSYPCPLPIPGLAMAVDTSIWDGLVVSTRAAKEDWVRRAAATEPMARPPSRPRSSTIVR